MAHDILVVDDEADIREMIAGILDDEGYGTRMASDSDTAIAAIKDRRPSLVVLDIWLQGSRLDGLALLDVIKETDPDLPVVIISGHGNVETAVSAIKRGAYDYIEKPFKADRLVHIVERALEASEGSTGGGDDDDFSRHVDVLFLALALAWCGPVPAVIARQSRGPARRIGSPESVSRPCTDLPQAPVRILAVAAWGQCADSIAAK